MPEEEFVVLMKGVPWSSATSELQSFFDPSGAKCIGVNILNDGNRPSGNAEAYFQSKEDAEKAMSMNRKYLGARFVVLEPKFERTAGGAGRGAGGGAEGGAGEGSGTTKIHMSGLVFSATEQQIKNWFLEAGSKCTRVEILMERGRPSGRAVAEFEGNEDVAKAMTRDRAYLGKRFVRLERAYVED